MRHVHTLNPYALAALKDLHSTLAGEIVNLQTELHRKRDAIQNVDAVLRLVAPDLVPGSLPRRRIRPVSLYRAPNVTRAILTALRRHGAPMRLPEIAASIAADLSFPPEAAKGIAPNIRYTLRNMMQDGRKRLIRSEEDGVVRWRLS